MHHVALVVLRGDNLAEALNNVDRAMAPFDENLEVPTYTRWLDDEEVGQAVNFYRENPTLCGGDAPLRPFEDFVGEGDLDAWHEWTRAAVGGYHASGASQGVYDSINDRFGYTADYNPDGHWDWWQVGGRWNGYFMLNRGVRVGIEGRQRMFITGSKNNTSHIPLATEECDALLGIGGTGGDDDKNYDATADLVRKRDVDIQMMRTLAMQAADRDYDRFEKATEGLEIPPTWEEVRAEVYAKFGRDPKDENFRDFRTDIDDIEERRRLWNEPDKAARERYGSFPWVAAVRRAVKEGYAEGAFVMVGLNNHEDFCVGTGGRETYVQRAADNTMSFATVVIDGRWEERPWRYDDENKQEGGKAFDQRVWDLINALPDDAWLAAVDYHS